MEPKLATVLLGLSAASSVFWLLHSFAVRSYVYTLGRLLHKFFVR